MMAALSQGIPFNIVYVLSSVFLLWFGADWLVKGASKMALSMNIQPGNYWFDSHCFWHFGTGVGSQRYGGPRRQSRNCPG